MSDYEGPMVSPRKEYFGKYRGVVVDNKDPKKKGRLLVRVPAVLGSEKVWAMPCVPYAGKKKGWFTMPDKKVGIWVEFEAGKIDFPLWTGCFWNDRDIEEDGGNPDIKFFRTKKAMLRINDKDGEIILQNEDGSSLTFTAKEIVIKSGTVTQDAGKGKTTVLSSASFKVNDGNLEVL